MSRPDSLFLLIQSLSAGEKALVRQVDKGQAAYLALFDYMSRLKEYDERKAKKKLLTLGHDINFAFAKNYLTKHILRVLRENTTAGPHAGDRTVQEIEILMGRKAHDLAGKMLQKARKRALDEERWRDFLRLSETEMSLLSRSGHDLAASLADIDRLNAERRHARTQDANLGEFEDLYHRYRPVLMRKQAARNEWDLALIQELAGSPLLSDPKKATSVRAQRLFHMCQVLVHGFRGHHAGAHQALVALVGLYEAHAFLREDHPLGFLHDLYRLGGSHLAYKAFAEVERVLARMMAERDLRGLHDADIFDKFARLQLSYALESGRLADHEAALGSIEAGLAVHGEFIPWTSQAVLVFLMARACFELGRLRDAKRWLNHVLDHPDRAQREDIGSLARILLVFIHFENKDGDLAEASSRATRKYLQRRDALYQFERRILRFLEQHSFSEGPTLRGSLQQLQDDLAAIFQDPLEANILAFFDIMGWLKRRIAQMG